eukprot:TRINITY_DN5884_c0_g1_i11.p1 TRINITY_DN5884_c0_g1~~TRINITY_DN5884_c0_g1_i11.p1  ORF type:complete len:226 (+),score=43.76 TRINITY_DN5884_c0_g1_i11:452-1129(+)
MHDNEETVRMIPRILSNSSDEVPGAKVEILERIEEYTKNINIRLKHHHSRQREMRQVGEESQRAVMDALSESQLQQLQMEQKITQIEEKMQYQQLKNEEKIAQINQKLDQFKSEQARDLNRATFKIINAISDLSKKIGPNDSFSESDDLHLPPFQAQTSSNRQYIWNRNNENSSEREREEVSGNLSFEEVDTHHTSFAQLNLYFCLLYTSPSPRDLSTSRMPSSA